MYVCLPPLIQNPARERTYSKSSKRARAMSCSKSSKREKAERAGGAGGGTREHQREREGERERGPSLVETRGEEGEERDFALED